jgi:hypothetical protein
MICRGLFIALVLATSNAWADSHRSIGLFTGIFGAVSVTHAGTVTPLPVSVKDSVHFQDVIQTQAASRMRALLDDDTLLSLAEDSQLEITEHVYDPEASMRIAVLNLIRGSVRALVSKMSGAGSRFEIHTGSGIAAARGTYFVVWVDDHGSTGIANIGDEGDVAFIAVGQEVIVRPGHYSTTLRGAPPAVPLAIPPKGRAVQAIQVTEVRDNIAIQTPKHTVETVGGLLERSLPRPRFLKNTGPDVATAQERFTTPAVTSGAVGSSDGPVTPPAVISGAVRSSGIGSNRGPFPGFSNSGSSSMNSGPGSSNSGPGSLGSRSGSNSGPK